jgi:glycine C-acetyltransferase
MSSSSNTPGVPAAALQGSLRDYSFPSGPDLIDRVKEFFEWQDLRRQSGTWPFARATEAGPQAACAIRDDRGVRTTGVNFASQDYLSLAAHPEIKAAAKAAIDAMGVHSAGSSALVGNTATSFQLEQRLAAFCEMEEAVLFPTGWSAGYGVIKALVRSSDYVVMDLLSHSCLQMGAHGATRNVVAFRHLNTDDCRAKLAAVRAKAPQAGILLVTEALFSMDSDTPDLAAMRTLAEEFGATFLVDVAHDLGAIGPGGTGKIGEAGLLGDIDLVIGAFSKTFASNGGFVATHSRAVKEYLRYYSQTCTFSNGLSPVQTAIVSKALDIVQSDEGDARREALMRNVLGLRHALTSRGLDVHGDPSAIVAVKTGDEALSRLMSRELPDLGLLANLVEFPAVPRNQARFRLQVMADHSAADVDFAGIAMQRALRAAEASLAATPGPADTLFDLAG